MLNNVSGLVVLFVTLNLIKACLLYLLQEEILALNQSCSSCCRCRDYERLQSEFSTKQQELIDLRSAHGRLQKVPPLRKCFYLSKIDDNDKINIDDKILRWQNLIIKNILR